MVGACPVHALGASAAPEIASAYDNADLHAHVGALFDRCTDSADDLVIQTEMLVSCQSLTAQFEQHAGIFSLHIDHAFPIKFLLRDKPHNNILNLFYTKYNKM